MQEIEIQDLLKKHSDGTLTPDEKELLENWYLQWEVKPQALTEERMTDITAEIYSRLPQPGRTVGLWKRVAVAATVATIIFGAGLFYFSNDKKADEPSVAFVNDIKPGKVGATLTLANGLKINLTDASNGELAREAGISVSKTADGQLVYAAKSSAGEPGKINTLTTAKGETYILTLPDKSQVWMNAASSLTYATSLNERGERRVKLSGEAYFQIAKDKAHPFIVETDKQEVEVLGTHFNVNSYANELITKTTLLEGSVKIRAGKLEKILRPNQQAVLSGDKIQVDDVEAEYEVAWKNGFFMFNGERLESIMAKVSRWYNVEIEYKDPELKSKEFLGTISKFETISKVLNMLERTQVVSFKIKGNKIIVEKKK
jgi:transmembrane sensor